MPSRAARTVKIQRTEIRATLKSLRAQTGTLTKASKMPGLGFSLPALESCPTGARLALIPGSVCSRCYALRGNFTFRNVKFSHRRNLRLVQAAIEGGPETREAWVSAMVDLIRRTSKVDVFRIHVSGDFFSVEYFLLWVEIARRLPEMRFWAPTRESQIDRLGAMVAPANLLIRYSGPMIGEKTRSQGPASMVLRKGQEPPEGVNKCPAYTQGGACLDCRNCWDRDVAQVGYPEH
jgi:hypothetical protein